MCASYFGPPPALPAPDAAPLDDSLFNKYFHLTSTGDDGSGDDEPSDDEPSGDARSGDGAEDRADR